MNYFSATTNDRDSLFGYGKAEFFYDDDKWLIKNYEFIDSFESEKHDISEIAGTWNEVDTLYPRTLVIKNDGSFTITFTNGGTMYGIAKVEEIGYPNGSIMTKSVSPYLVLLDVMLPDGDGMDFCKIFRKNTGCDISHSL